MHNQRPQWVNEIWHGNSNGLGMTITADSDPLTSEFNCAEWMAWHKALKQRHGKDMANSLFASAWEDFNNEFDFFSLIDPFNFAGRRCSTDTNLHTYLLSQGLDVRSVAGKAVLTAKGLFSDSFEVIEDSGEALTKVVKDTGQVLTKASGGINNTVGVAKTLLPIGLTAVGLFAAVTLYQSATGKKKINIGPLSI